MKSARNPDTVHPPIGFYSHQIEVSGTPRWLVISGQVGRTLDGAVPADPIEQLSLALDNVRRNLDAAEMAVSDIVKVNWYLVGDVDTAARREVTKAWLGDHEPCSTLVYVARLAAPEYRVEVEAWACRP
jgi:2-iminobutanoate/2-iminopropanoate deaminase